MTCPSTASVPQGWKLVPIEPTPEMLDAGLQATAFNLGLTGSALTINREKMRRRYIAALAKSPNFQDSTLEMKDSVLMDFTADEVRALLARCCSPLRGADPEEAGLAPAVREHRIVEAHYCSAYDKLMAARRETI